MPSLVEAPQVIDLDTVGAFREALRLTIREHRAETVWADLGRVTAMDPVGIGVLVGCRKYALGWGGDLLLVAPSPLVVSSLRTTGFHRMLPIDLDASAMVALLT